MNNRVVTILLYLVWIGIVNIMPTGQSQDVEVEIAGPSCLSLPPALQPFDLNNDGILDAEEKAAMKKMLEPYFKDKKMDMSKVEKHLHHRAEEAKRSASDSSSSADESGSSNSASGIPEILMQAVSDCLNEVQEEKDKMVKTSVNKKKAYSATAVTALTGICTTLLVKYLTFQCECDK